MRKVKITILMTIILMLTPFGLLILSKVQLLSGFDVSHAANLHKIKGRFQLEKEGKLLFKQGFYDEALDKFQAADATEFQIKGQPNGVARYRIREVYVMQKRYEEALENLETVLAIAPNHEKYLDEKLEYQTLIKYRDGFKTGPVYEVIENLRIKYAKQLPPNGFDPIASLRPISNIIRLYDTIGDYDAGIAFIDEILSFLRERKKARGESYEVYDRIKTSAQTTACMDIGPKENRDWHGCKFIKEYLLVREAFEAEKRNGGPTCGKWGKVQETGRGAKIGDGSIFDGPKVPGTKKGDQPQGRRASTQSQDQPEYCIGDATKALIQSDYFPW